MKTMGNIIQQVTFNIYIFSFAYKLACCLHLFADGEHIDLGRMETVEKNLEYGS